MFLWVVLSAENLGSRIPEKNEYLFDSAITINSLGLLFTKMMGMATGNERVIDIALTQK